ncbi:hypothetical protein [Endozoicomonas ascidiicola]|uniref:hypothetical protein n=1 Tax=Endozoicomonas ascidiicola TaxID=1698521 RepID=UPI000834C414|nr:hypothetical protein [Endozoicomonas ascidiicola]
MGTENTHDMKYGDLVDRVMMLEQEQGSISQIQRHQLATLARLADLNTFISGYADLIGELRNSQRNVMDRCEAMNQKLDSLLMSMEN